MTYYIYKIINNLNNKFYIGAHSTNNIEDNYMGSGSILNKALAKYGKSNFSKEILFNFDNESDMYLKEAEIVDIEFINRTDTYNLKPGGIGGWTFINENKLNKTEKNRLSRINNLKIANKVNVQKVLNGTHRKGFTHSEETKKKMIETRTGMFKGEKNPMFGKKIVNKDGVNKTILIVEIDYYIESGWKLGQIQNRKSTKGTNNPQSGKIWITNGIENKILSKLDSIPFINDGWRKGRTKNL